MQSKPNKWFVKLRSIKYTLERKY